MASNPSSAAAGSQGSLGLSNAELRALEATRFRLQNLSNSIASFQNDLMMNRPLPNPCVSTPFILFLSAYDLGRLDN